jgi:hypothetical protein
MSYGFSRREAAEYDRWKTTPPDDDIPECPVCGSSITNDCGDWSCDNDECDWIAQEPDYPDYDYEEDDE